MHKKELQLPLGEMKEADELAVLRKELKNKEESRGNIKNIFLLSLDFFYTRYPI